MAKLGRIFGHVIGLCVLLVPAILLAVFSWPHLLSGMAQEGVVPVPNRMILRIPLPKLAYADAASVLSSAPVVDGESMLLRAESARLGGKTDVRPLIIVGLSHQPASVRGWLLLAEAETEAGSYPEASRAMSQALLLSRRDYYLSGKRVQDAAALWPYLDSSSRTSALEQAHLLWEEPSLRPQLRLVLVDQPGVMIMTKAFAASPDEIRRLNRWLFLHPNILPFSRGY